MWSCPSCSGTLVFPVLLAVPALLVAGEKMAASPLNLGVKSLSEEQFSPGRMSAQKAMVLPSYWVEVGPWRALSQLFWHSDDP